MKKLVFALLFSTSSIVYSMKNDEEESRKKILLECLFETCPILKDFSENERTITYSIVEPFSKQLYGNVNLDSWMECFKPSDYNKTLETLKVKAISKETGFSKFINEVDSLIKSARSLYDKEKIWDKHQFRMMLDSKSQPILETTSDEYIISSMLLSNINKKAINAKSKELLNENIIAEGYTVILKIQSFIQTIEENNYQKDSKVIWAKLKSPSTDEGTIKYLYDTRIQSFKDLLNTYCKEMNYTPKKK